MVPANPYKLDEFKSTNDSVQLGNIGRVKNGFLNDVISTIQHAFAGQEKNWYNFKEANKSAYEAGKMKKFLNTVKLLIQDSILSLCQKTFANYD